MRAKNPELRLIENFAENCILFILLYEQIQLQ